MSYLLRCRAAVHIGSPIWHQSTRFKSTLTSYSGSVVKNKSYRVLFFGETAYSLEVLKALNNWRLSDNTMIDSISVVCPKSISTGLKRRVLVRESLLDTFAKENSLGSNWVNNNDEMQSWSIPEGWPKFDIAVVAGCRWRLPKSLENKFSEGVVSVHPSLLPKHRGPTPVISAMLSDSRETGVTVCEYSFDRVDSGNILAQLPYTIEKGYTREDVLRDLGYLGGKLLVKSIENIDHLKKHAVRQNMYEANYSRYYDNDDEVRVIWETMGADEIVKLNEAFHGKRATHTIFRKKDSMAKVFLYDMHVADKSTEPLDAEFLKYPPGSIFYRRKVPYLEVPCIDGKRLHITRLGREGRSIMTGLQYVNGYLRLSGALRFLSYPVEPVKPTPKFQYPPGYVKPTLTDVYSPAESQKLLATSKKHKASDRNKIKQLIESMCDE
ncbi:Methionyl-tRNA formyltransferase [Coemansia sp. RSA 1722]|nr:Methionyl-tRNA formyltransferase [Coemansia sp. RSA 1722]